MAELPEKETNTRAFGVERSTRDERQLPGDFRPLRPHAIVINSLQKRNPIVNLIRNVPYEFGDVVPDYVMSPTSCALFLSLKYHNLYPDYIHGRLKDLGNNFALRVLLVVVDIVDSQKSLQEIAVIAVLANCTLILAWSLEEAARYLETYKAFENKPPDILKERVEKDYMSRLVDCLTTAKSVNKNDAATLSKNFETLTNIVSASPSDIAKCPGLGQSKAKRLHDLFHQPFLAGKKTESSRQTLDSEKEEETSQGNE
ncbi:DNA excision repair protein ERCC-1-like [Oscarella lobularis]|uniref:DNA excision repair protein ERCC-1-like n=1 Tax=Oscarella lobularis TaxID=121494 RepID=UPI0033138270